MGCVNPPSPVTLERNVPGPIPATVHEQYQELLPTLERMRSIAESTLQQAIVQY